MISYLRNLQSQNSNVCLSTLCIDDEVVRNFIIKNPKYEIISIIDKDIIIFTKDLTKYSKNSAKIFAISTNYSFTYSVRLNINPLNISNSTD